MHIGLEDRLLLAPLVGILLAQPHDRAQGLDVEAVGLGLAIDVPDVIGDGFLLFLQPLDALHEGFQVILGKAGGWPLFLGGGGSGHRNLLWRLERAERVSGFGSAGLQVKARERSSPEYTGPPT